MPEIGRRRRRQPAPPHVVREALVDPDRDPARPWLVLLDDEIRPAVLRDEASELTWSSLWPRRPDARVHFTLAPGADGGTDLEWTLVVDEPAPDAALTGHLRLRLNQLVNAGLRSTFGQ